MTGLLGGLFANQFDYSDYVRAQANQAGAYLDMLARSQANSMQFTNPPARKQPSEERLARALKSLSFIRGALSIRRVVECERHEPYLMWLNGRRIAELERQAREAT